MVEFGLLGSARTQLSSMVRASENLPIQHNAQIRASGSSETGILTAERILSIISGTDLSYCSDIK